MRRTFFHRAREKFGAPEARETCSWPAPERIDRPPSGSAMATPSRLRRSPQRRFFLGPSKQASCGRLHFRRDVLASPPATAIGRYHRPRRLIAHQAAMKAISLAVRRPCRIRQFGAACIIAFISPRGPASRKVKGLRRTSCCPLRAQRSPRKRLRLGPVVFVHVHVGGRDLPEVAGKPVNESQGVARKRRLLSRRSREFPIPWPARSVAFRSKAGRWSCHRADQRGVARRPLRGQFLGRATGALTTYN